MPILPTTKAPNATTSMPIPVREASFEASRAVWTISSFVTAMLYNSISVSIYPSSGAVFMAIYNLL